MLSIWKLILDVCFIRSFGGLLIGCLGGSCCCGRPCGAGTNRRVAPWRRPTGKRAPSSASPPTPPASWTMPGGLGANKKDGFNGKPSFSYMCVMNFFTEYYISGVISELISPTALLDHTSTKGATFIRPAGRFAHCLRGPPKPKG